MLILSSIAAGADLGTYDPASWVSQGMAPSTARELADPVTTPRVGTSGLLNVGFGTEDVGGGGLARSGMTRVFLGVDGDASGSESTYESYRSVEYDRWAHAQLEVATRVGLTGVSLHLSGATFDGSIGEAGDGGPDLGSLRTAEEVEPGELRGRELDGRLLAEWGREVDEVRPRFGVLLVGNVSAASMEFTSPSNPDESWAGDPSVWMDLTGTGGWDNRWQAGTGVRGALDLGGTNADPRTHLWAEVVGRGGTPVETESTHTSGDSVERLRLEDAWRWDADVEIGLSRRFGGADAAVWVGGVGTLGFDGSKERAVLTQDDAELEREVSSSAGKSASLTLRAAGFADVAPMFRLWAGIEPTASWSSRTDENMDTDTSLDVDWNGRLAMEWHHPRGFVAALAWGISESGVSGYSTEASSLFGSNTALWVGWRPE